MAAKPYHAGHDALVRLAARENDEVRLYVSLVDRDSISGDGMERVWQDLIVATLPNNVKITYEGSPVGNVYKALGEAELAHSDDIFSIYSDVDDAANNYKTLSRYASSLVSRCLVRVRPIQRTSTVNISGTQMRQWFDEGDMTSFVAHMPQGIGERAWEILKATPPGPLKKRTGRKPKSG